MKLYWRVFYSFFKIGLCTFGGGYAMLPFLQRELVARGWVSKKEVLDYYAFSQITPGIIAVNVSTFVGYKLRGWKGACCSMAGIVMPSVIIITLFALGLDSLWAYPLMQSVVASIQLMIPALMLPIVFRMIKDRATTAFGIELMLLAFILAMCGMPAVYILLICAGISLFVFYRRYR